MPDVSTPAELNNVRNTLWDHYTQTADIDLTGWGEWQPIGYYEDPLLFAPHHANWLRSFFRGTYNGNGYKIYGMTINNFSQEKGIGLFGAGAHLERGYPQPFIENVHLRDVRINVDPGSNRHTRGYVGGLIGSWLPMSDQLHIENCSVTGTIHNGGIYTGGMMGGSLDEIPRSPQISNLEGPMFKKCWVNGEVTSDAFAAGGLAGYLSAPPQIDTSGDRTTWRPVVLHDCFTRGSVRAYGTYYGSLSDLCAGGIVGRANDAEIERVYSTCEVESPDRAGGIIGDYELKTFIGWCMLPYEYHPRYVIAHNPVIERNTGSGTNFGRCIGRYYNNWQPSQLCPMVGGWARDDMIYRTTGGDSIVFPNHSANRELKDGEDFDHATKAFDESFYTNYIGSFSFPLTWRIVPIINNNYPYLYGNRPPEYGLAHIDLETEGRGYKHPALATVRLAYAATEDGRIVMFGETEDESHLYPTTRGIFMQTRGYLQKVGDS